MQYMSGYQASSVERRAGGFLVGVRVGINLRIIFRFESRHGVCMWN